MADSDDEPITLSSHALDALHEFYAERDARAQKFKQLKADAEADADASADCNSRLAPTYPLSMEAFVEDWNASQFWYADETANLLARELLEGATAETKIAVVSAPSVFVALQNILASRDTSISRPTLYLLEHDRRFAIFPEFIFYDFMQPINLPAMLKSSIHRLIVDPPFLSEDCQTKAALTVRWMAAPDSKLILCTGERMETLVTTKLYASMELHTTTFEPAHARGLSNEFYCFANFEGAGWTWKATGPG